MLKTAKIPIDPTLETFDFAFQPAIERSRIETLATGAWIRNSEVVLMQGPPGGRQVASALWTRHPGNPAQLLNPVLPL